MSVDAKRPRERPRAATAVAAVGGGRGVRASCAAVLCAALAVTGSAHAAPSEDARREAKQLFEQAVKQAESGDSKAALVSFRAAYAKAPSFRVLYNIGQLCGRIGDAACAVRAYKQYLDEGGAQVPAARRQSVEAEVRSLSRTLGTLKVQTSVSDADVAVDDEPVGKTPLAPVPVNGGAHRVVLTYKDKSVEKGVVVVSGGTTSVTLEPPPADDAAAVAPPPAEEAKPAPPPPHDEPPPAKSTPVVPWIVTGALAAGTAVTGVLAATSYSSFKQKRDAYPITRDDLDSAQGSARDLFILTCVFGAATLVSAGVAGWLTLSSSGSAKVGVAVGPTGALLHVDTQ